ncbi:uracil-DNA glycosylase [Metamycoplasma neophronis]|uniref:Uracil-DNA glycosylase n=1 Tax=Metamycoplasma neophronis TaxID=872983 RepID=A0ABY2Z3Z8_9BACT|nr:uracil-DNA glycosylase [Metamycoplasma neophronis]TPR53875.1 uracil-DNA glycosylase [Metamycoplasma neophronis]
MKFNFETFLNQEKQKPYFKKIENILDLDNITPRKEDVFNAFKNFDFDNIKVIIIGQDPYPGKNVADGLCFSSKETETPASLKNMFEEIKASYPQSIHSSNQLTNWKDQGVLLLNTILTNEINKTLAHKDIGWEIFTTELLREINLNYENIIYLILGKKAENFVSKLNLDKQIVLITSHPSPLGVYRGFRGSKIFEKINDKLVSIYKKPIIWNT